MSVTLRAVPQWPLSNCFQRWGGGHLHIVDYGSEKPLTEGQEVSSYCLIKQSWRIFKSLEQPSPRKQPPSGPVRLKAKMSWLTSPVGGWSVYGSDPRMTFPLEESGSWEPEVPGFFMSRRGVYQDDWQGTRMHASQASNGDRYFPFSFQDHWVLFNLVRGSWTN